MSEVHEAKARLKIKHDNSLGGGHDLIQHKRMDVDALLADHTRLEKLVEKLEGELKAKKKPE